MKSVTRMAMRCDRLFARVLPFGLMFLAGTDPAHAAGCSFEPQGEGRVAAVLDARSFRLEDGREVRPAGIEPVVTEAANGTAALAAIVAGRDVTLRGDDDTPDRYGRQPAFVFFEGSENPVQARLLAEGEALVSGTVTDKESVHRFWVPRKRRHERPRRNLGRSRGHKKRRKFGRYFGRDRALYSGRRQGFVGPAGRRNDIPELRTELDSGLCCDYFKAHDRGIRGCRDWTQVARKSTDSCPRVG